MFVCYGKEKLENNCQNLVENEFGLCKDCKEIYWGRHHNTKRKWTLEEIRNQLKQWGKESKREDERNENNIRNTLL